MSGYRLMAVHAHPDDESSKGAATTAKYAAEGNDVLVVSLTGGERGSILNPAMDPAEAVLRPRLQHPADGDIRRGVRADRRAVPDAGVAGSVPQDGRRARRQVRPGHHPDRMLQVLPAA